MKRIFLIGYMGAGKTTVGKDLAKRMGLSFIDLDCYIEARYHRTVGQIFAEKGEAAFRDIERRMLHEVAMFEDVLISTGGGAPCFFDNMEFMNRTGKTVFLNVHPDVLFRRLKGRSGDELVAFIAESLEKRTPHYMKASIVFDAEVMLTETDVHEISEALEKIV